MKRNSGTNSRVEIRRLERLAYGTERPALAEETQHAENYATQLIEKLDEREHFFPNSFGVLAQTLRGWTTNESTELSGIH